MSVNNDFVLNFISRLQQLHSGEQEKCYSALAPIIAIMAKTGKGTEACLDQGCLPLPVDCYSPIPDIADLKRRKIYDKVSKMAGIEWNVDIQKDFFLYLGRRFGRECIWPPHSTGNPDDFFTENSNFSFGCAASLHSIIRFFKPQRVVEIGSGNSSKIINAALAQNANEHGSLSSYTIIDPYPDEARIGRLAGVTNLIPNLVENVPVSFFRELCDGDVLFIDSSHVVKTGGDVTFMILDVLPTLAPGVVIHFHDISMPYEYPEVYHTNPAFRVFWTESYLLQAFLSCNAEFEVLFSMTAINKHGDDLVQRAFPHYDPTRHLLQSGSIWLRRKKSI